MKWSSLFFKTDSFRFTFILTLFAVVLGVYFYTIPFAAEHIYFFLSAPTATIFSCYFTWKWIFKKTKDYKLGNVLALGMFLTLVIHYLNFVILGIGRILCYYILGNSTETESFLGTLTYFSWIRMLISLYYFGLVTFIIISSIGFYIIRTSKFQDNKAI